MRFWIDIENSAGTKQGSGPITAALHWRSVKRLDRAGEFSFEMPVTDSGASLVVSQRVARCYAVIGGAVAEVGAGVIDLISVRIGEDGQPLLVVSGPDLLTELRWITVDWNVTVMPTFDDVDDAPYDIIHSYANDRLASAWTLADEAGSTIGSGTAVTGDLVYALFSHESCLNALIQVAQATGEHFRLGSGRTLEWVNSWSSSGIHAVYGAPSPVAVEGRTEIAQIANIEWIQDSQDVVNRVFLFGSGEGSMRVTVQAADEWPNGTAISGSGPFYETIGGIDYGLSKDTASTAPYDTFFSLTDVDSYGTYGAREMKLTFSQITPHENTSADVVSAANQLLRSGYNWLVNRAYPQDFYRLSVRGLQQVLEVGTTIQVTARRYVDGQAAVNIDQALNVLEVTTEVDVDGLRTSELVVSTADRQPESDVGVLAAGVSSAAVSAAHPQSIGNSYTESFVDNMDDATNADFYFWLGEDVGPIKQLLLRFRVDELKSTVRSVAGSSTGSGGSSTSNSGWTASPAGYSGSQSVSHTHAETGTTTGVESANHQHYVTPSSHTHTIDHTHTFTPVVSTTYGVYEQASGNTYGHSGGSATLAQIQNDIDIMVGGSDRSASVLSTAASGWFELDVTSWLINSTTKMPTAAANLITFAKASGGAANKSARIVFKLFVRCASQSLDYQ